MLEIHQSRVCSDLPDLWYAERMSRLGAVAQPEEYSSNML